MTVRISEEQMANEFEVLLKSKEGIKEFPIFTTVFREVSCQQGIPDFVTISGVELDEIVHKRAISSNITLECSSLILSLLKPRSPRTIDYLVRSSGLSLHTLKRNLKELEAEGLIKTTEKGSFLLSDNWQKPTEIELWAFELKLKNWKRALFQALQYKAFSNRVVVVFPYDKEDILREHMELFRKFRIGIMLFDTITKSYKMILKPYKLNPSSKRYNLYTIGKLANELGDEE